MNWYWQYRDGSLRSHTRARHPPPAADAGPEACPWQCPLLPGHGDTIQRWDGVPTLGVVGALKHECLQEEGNLITSYQFNKNHLFKSFRLILSSNYCKYPFWLEVTRHIAILYIPMSRSLLWLEIDDYSEPFVMHFKSNLLKSILFRSGQE